MKRVAAINDLSGLGKCSLTAAIPVLAALGVQACPLPTAVLSHQTGFPTYEWFLQEDVFSRFTRAWKKTAVSFDGIFTGFLADETQLHEAEAFIRDFRTPDTLVLVDPVMADDGKRYDLFSEAFCRQMRGLVRLADVVTPNLTELCLLTDTDFGEMTALSGRSDYLERVAALGDRLTAQGVKAVLVTGVHRGDLVYNVVCGESGHAFVSSPRIGGSYSGTGDLFASVVGGSMLLGLSAEEATRCAASFLEAALRDTVAAGTDRNEGLCFEPHLGQLTEVARHVRP